MASTSRRQENTFGKAPQPDSAAADVSTWPRSKYPSVFYLLGTVPALLLVVCHSRLDGCLRYCAPAAFTLVLVPVLGLVFGPMPPTRGREPQRKVPHNAVHSLHDSPGFRAVVLSHCVFSVLSIAYSLFLAARSTRVPHGFRDTTLYVVSLTSVGINLIVAAHELIHKVDRRSAFDRALGWFVLSLMLNPAYAVDHHFHHLYIGTEKDAATACRGETFFRFFVRMESISWSRAIQASTLRSPGKANMLPSVPGSDRFVNGIVVSLSSMFLVFVTLGLKAMAFYVVACFLATMFLDSANYVEHYGLVRHVQDDGELEPIGVQHSWDSSHLITNLFFFQVGGHAAHHMQGTLPYPELDVGRGPVLPYDLVTMTLMSFFPCAFFQVMHPILDRMAAERKSS